MALADSYVQTYGQLGEVFKRLSEGQAPEKLTRQHLKDLGFESTSFHAVIPLLKTLGFLAQDGSPTARYHDYRDQSQARVVLGRAVREAYSDLFTIKSNPTPADRALIEGKFKSAHNISERIAQLMTSTFFSLLALADLNEPAMKPIDVVSTNAKVEFASPLQHKETPSGSHRPTLHYNIQIHLPATKDVEVFNAIFKSLREHLLD
jgi:Family of unknown function (DUF5343)